MTVKELIDRLQKFGPEMRVVTPGFDESHFDDVSTVEEVRIAFHDDRKEGHVGRHRESESRSDPLAVLINF